MLNLYQDPGRRILREVYMREYYRRPYAFTVQCIRSLFNPPSRQWAIPRFIEAIATERQNWLSAKQLIQIGD